MVSLSSIFGWNYFADWSGKNSLKNFPAANIETAIALAWEERCAWTPCQPARHAAFRRNCVANYAGGIASWWLNLIPHVNINGRYVIYDGVTPPPRGSGGYGWKGIAFRSGAIPNLMPAVGNASGGCGYIPDFITWPHALSIAEMEDLIDETILPYPYNRPLSDAGYYFQFYKILNAVRRRLYYNSPSSWFTGLEDNTWTDVGATALAGLLARNNIYAFYIYRHEAGDRYTVRLMTVKTGQTAAFPEDCYMRLISAGNTVQTGTDAGYTFYKHFEPGDTFIIDPPVIPAPVADSYLYQAIAPASIEDRSSVADKFVFRSS